MRTPVGPTDVVLCYAKASCASSRTPPARSRCRGLAAPQPGGKTPFKNHCYGNNAAVEGEVIVQGEKTPERDGFCVHGRC
eukprot:11651004-Heterocapsa_arctica.AAC.1